MYFHLDLVIRKVEKIAMSPIFALIKRGLALTSFSFFTLKPRLKEFLQIRILGKHKIVRVQKVAENSSPKKIAILALFPRGSLLISTLRLIDQLIINDYQVIAVVNDGTLKYQEWLIELEARDITILTRPNIGRDFGAYQAGIQYMQNMPSYATVERMVLANDSLYYFPSSTEFLDELLMDSDSWYGMYVNFHIHIHAQSFFESFDRAIFTSKSFLNFWSAYYPTNIRHNVIYKGEAGLTATLVASGHFPRAFITPLLIESSPKFKNFTVEEKYAMWNGFGFTAHEFNLRSEEISILQFRRIFSHLNPSHHAGIISTRILGAPLKLDLLRTGLNSLHGIMEIAALSGIQGDELRQFELEMSSRGSDASVTGLHKLWRTYGFE